MKILIVEDDLMLGKLIKIALENNKYICDWVVDVSEFKTALELSEYGMIILDINLPDQSGIELVKILRNNKNSIPILILTALSSQQQKIDGLDSGADDYMTKPFDLEEFLARIRSLSRRNKSLTSNIIKHRNLVINIDSYQVTIDDKIIEFSNKDFLILKTLLENIGKVISKNRLENLIYNWDDSIESNTIEVHIHNIRKKIGNQIIKTVRSAGYMIN